MGSAPHDISEMSTCCLSVARMPTTNAIRAMIVLAVALSAGALFAGGRVFWQEGGVVVCENTASGAQAAASDQSGGVYVVWCDTRGRMGASGLSTWTAMGMRCGSRTGCLSEAAIPTVLTNFR
jgi:hypothetical protein